MKNKQTLILGILIILLIMVPGSIFAQKFNGLALTPPMGWNSWNKFGCEVSEQLLRETADAMVSSGMKDAGYQYIIIDDCWHGKRDSLGFIQPNPERFPSGIKATIDYIHSKGLKFGIYSCAGAKTCAGRPASRGYEYQDAMTYAQWGVDYLKYDWCNTENLNAIGSYTTMRDALYAAGRPIVFSMCEWGSNKPWEWGSDIGHLWRTTGDIYNCWDCKFDHGGWFSWGVLQILDMQDGLRTYAGPDHWNDPDMLEVGNGMSYNEDRAHFSIWSMLAAPLIAGNDLRNMSMETKSILENKEIIAVDQDSLGIQGYKYKAIDSLDIWVKPLMNNEIAVCFLNRKATPQTINFDWKISPLVDEFSGLNVDFNNQVFTIRDLWLKKNIASTKKMLSATIKGHDVLMLKLSPIKK